MFHRNRPGKPCSHMTNLLHEAADGRARGWRLWYAVSHSARCVPCGQFLRSLQATLGRLKAIGAEPEDPASLERLKQKVRDAAKDDRPAA